MRLNEPSKEFIFEEDEMTPIVSCISWLPPDNNLFAAGYESGHLVFFEIATGKV